MCGGCKHPFVDLYDLTRNVNDGAIYRDGQQVACASCHLTQQEGTCVFVEGIGDRTVTGADVKAAMEEIRKVPCKYCANADLVHGGKVVVNYVVHGCIKHGSVIC
ncbi:unnamed protein product [Periconia digitata]|uniref:Killer toxin Kp4 domain-containing protein n=1 Tax=Periconia digitata TaxID=1303443 RepID=A0A9W4UTK5_9PLEO|nr:unnamed protein product [Periconia digitata]